VRASLASLAAALGLAASFAACDLPTVGAGHDGGQGDCVSCHLPEYQAAGHHAGEKPTTCAVCHGSDAWHPTGLHHSWALVGAHEKTRCFECHKGDPPMFKGTAKACAGCHRDEFDKAADHVGHFALTCEDCHTTTAWKPLVPNPKWPAAPPAPTATATATASAKVNAKPAPMPMRPRQAPTPSPTRPLPAPPAPTPDVTSRASPRR
jgi:hypothetical protein